MKYLSVFIICTTGIEPATFTMSNERSSPGFFCFEHRLGGRRIELLASSMSTTHSTTELTAHSVFGFQRRIPRNDSQSFRPLRYARVLEPLSTRYFLMMPRSRTGINGVCLKKLEPILRRTLKTNADSAGRNI